MFIVQGKGKRRWQAGKVDKSQCQNEVSQDLLQVSNPEGFEPIVDEILEMATLFISHLLVLTKAIPLKTPSITPLVLEHRASKSCSVIRRSLN